MYTAKSTLPDFFIIGAAKSGTTALYDYLRQHQDIYFPDVKEPHFFDVDDNYKKGLDWYVDYFFSGNKEKRLQGEATPTYLSRHHKVIRRMKDAYNDHTPKFIAVFRDPVNRAWSHYLHRRREYFYVEKEPFEKALELEDERLKTDPADWAGYFNDGLYSNQLKAWLSQFPRENFLFLLNDDLKSDYVSALHNVCDFLCIDKDGFNPVPLVSNRQSEPRNLFIMKMVAEENFAKKIARFLIRDLRTKEKIFNFIKKMSLRPSSKAELPDKLEAMLREKYRDSITELEQIINRDLSAWK